MRKVILFNMLTVDGYFEGPKKWDLSWHQVDQEFNDFAIDQLDHSGGLIFGRMTYEGMAAYWSSPQASENDPDVSVRMNDLPKYVFSKTLQRADWKNTHIMKGDAIEELRKLKQKPGKSLLIFGSADLSLTFIRHDLIDEFRLMLNPIVLGRGVPFFKENGEPHRLKLLKIRSFHNGNLLLSYSPENRILISQE